MVTKNSNGMKSAFVKLVPWFSMVLFGVLAYYITGEMDKKILPIKMDIQQHGSRLKHLEESAVETPKSILTLGEKSAKLIGDVHKRIQALSTKHQEDIQEAKIADVGVKAKIDSIDVTQQELKSDVKEMRKDTQEILRILENK